MAYSSKKQASFPLELFHVLADRSPFGVFIWQIEDEKEVGECLNIFVNKRALSILKIKEKAVLYRKTKDAFPGIEQSNFPMVYKKLIKTHQPQSIPSFAYGDSQIKASHFRVELVPLDKLHLAVFFIDIGRQVDAQKQLSEKVEELERLSEFMVGRELKMMELKKENAELGKKLKRGSKKRG